MKPWRDVRLLAPLWIAAGVTLSVLGRAPLATLAGLLGWPLLEYAVHRWAMHGLQRWPRLYAKAHGAHHRWPQDPGHYTVPVEAAVPAAILLTTLLGPAPMGGLLVAFGAYDLFHYSLHLDGWAPAWARGHHERHHRDPRTCYAVTLPALDRVLGSAEAP